MSFLGSVAGQDPKTLAKGLQKKDKKQSKPFGMIYAVSLSMCSYCQYNVSLLQLLVIRDQARTIFPL